MATKVTIEDQRKWNLVSKKRANDELYKDATEGVDYVVCKECGLKASQMSKHVQTHHKLTPDEYYIKYSCDRSALMSQHYLNQLTKRALTNNPAKDHGGKFSAHSPKFFKYQGLPEDEVAAKIATVKAYTSLKRTEIPSNTTIEYWLERTDGNLDEAKKLQSDRQRTFSLEKCIEKYGDEAGTKRWSDRQQKWSKSYTASGGKSGISVIGTEFASKLPSGDGIFSALNNEASITIKMVASDGKLIHRTIRPDYVDNNQRKVIEFHGDYFHANPAKYHEKQLIRKQYKGKDALLAKDVWERDARKLTGLRQLGYKVHIVWENDYRNNPDTIIQECLQFLTNQVPHY